MIGFIKKIMKTVMGTSQTQDKDSTTDKEEFNPRIRKDSENMTDVEKMDRGFNGKTYTINGIEGDF